MGVCVLGSINLDIVCAVDELPAPGETIIAGSVSRYPGGKGLNQAVAAARWGAATSMVGAVGADEAGAELRSVLEEAGVDTAAVATLADAPTGHGYIFVSTAAENMIVVAGGANLGVTPGAAAAAPASPGGVWLAQLETPLPSVSAFMTRPGADQAVKVLNGAPAVAGGEALFPLVDILIVNETELARYAGATEVPSHIDEVVALARRLISREGQAVVVTLGAAGAAAVSADGVVIAAGRPARAVDTTGAGDCFCGVLAAALSEGAALADAMLQANAAAALSTQTHGAAVSMPSREATEMFAAGPP
jgi:ribokinase